MIPAIKISDSLTGKKVEFSPLDKNNIRLYVCGPTVYDRAHIGNARSAVVFDLWFRLLQKSYKKVTFVRNITDIDDKIINRASEEGLSVEKIVKRATDWYHQDLAYLNCLKPTVEPAVSNHLEEIFAIIKLLLNKGFAYESEGNILFDTTKTTEGFAYGDLSKKKIEDLIAGIRVEVEGYKKNAGDFILWKPFSKQEVGYNSPFGYGRPGWHTECSVMSVKYLGNSFDIHGGGADLKFPHHENEIVQSRCGFGGIYAKYWIHNGMVLVNDEKMSKSLGNFITVEDLRKQNISGNAIRLALLSTHYHKPLNYTENLIKQMGEKISYFNRIIQDYTGDGGEVTGEVLDALYNDLNTPKAIERLNNLAKQINSGEKNLIPEFFATYSFLGFQKEQVLEEDSAWIEELIFERAGAKKAKDFKRADEIRGALLKKGIILEDLANGKTKWNKKGE
jgi:cysteinyl-tRNA synthetase